MERRNKGNYLVKPDTMSEDALVNTIRVPQPLPLVDAVQKLLSER